MLRRDFLSYVATSGIALSFPSIVNANQDKFKNKTLVLVELKGGNDGVNTLIPYADPLYYKLRPKLSINKDKVLKINDKFGFHPSMKGMYDIFKDGDLACLQGVGYENQNRSHFRSIEIWESASNPNEYLDDGWITDIFSKNKQNNVLDGLVMGKNTLGPMFGQGINTITIDNPNKFIKSAKHIKKNRGNIKTKNKALSFLLHVKDEIEKSQKIFAQKLISESSFKSTEFTKAKFSQSLYQSARIIASNIDIPVIKVSLGSFDTHSNQGRTHANLLQELSQGLLKFKKTLQIYDKWKDVLVVTYSEFGRRVYENASNGTDHGKASVHFALGGSVRGGLYGKYPSLDNLDNGNLLYNLDFKTIYNTIILDWWKMTPLARTKNFDKIAKLLI